MNRRRVWWSFVLVLIAAILVALFACSTMLDQSHYRPTQSWSVADTASPPRWYSAVPGDIYRPAWEYTKACSGLSEQPGGGYEDLTWLVVSHGGMRNAKGQRLIGVWLEPDTIVLDSLWIESAWLVAHELLHHLRHVMAEKDPHPQDPFMFPCMLMYFQNVVGGIMGQERSRASMTKGLPVSEPDGQYELNFIGVAIRKEGEGGLP